MLAGHVNHLDRLAAEIFAEHLNEQDPRVEWDPVPATTSQAAEPAPTRKATSAERDRHATQPERGDRHAA